MISRLFSTLALAAGLSMAKPAPQTDDFAIQMFRSLATTQEGNIVFSPTGAEAVLRLLQQGAAGETAAELASLPMGKRTMKTDITPQEANALFLAKDLELKPGIRTKKIIRVPFSTAPVQAVKSINQWAKKKTKGRITNLLTTDDISTQTRLIAAHTIYLKATWWYPFDPDTTSENTRFTLANGSTVHVDMMQQQANFCYAEGADWQAIAMLYDPDEVGTRGLARVRFIGILPKGDAREFARTLTAEQYRHICTSLAKNNAVDTIVYLPRFEIKTNTFSLKETLKACGLQHTLSESANFSGFTNSPLQISDVLQQCYISVNESGTEAAAATLAVMEEGCAMEDDTPSRPKVINFNRPFIWVISDLETAGAPFFMGLLEQP